MGCFSTCFGNKRRCRRNRKRNVQTNPSLLHHLQTYESVEGFEVPQLIKEEQQEEIEKGEDQIEVIPLISNDEKREKVHLSGRKKVTFDLNVQVYEDLRTEVEDNDDDFEEYDDLSENNNEEEIEDEEAIIEDKYAKVSVATQCNSDSSNSSLFSFPTNHRYQNCCHSDDEYDDILSSDESESDYYTDDDDDDDVESGIKSDKHEKVEDQSSESLFSLSLDSRKHEFNAERGDKEVNSPMPTKNSSLNDSNSEESDRNARKYVESVLNPVENLSQWKFIKARSKLASKDHQQNHQAKENIVVSGQNVSFPVKKEQVLEKEIGVDTSLSTWLNGASKNDNDNSRSSSVSIENAPSDRKICSPNKFEDRPILGALTMEEIRLISATSSPRKSPSKSPEDVPIIGSVGSYWSHTAQTADSGSSTKSTKSRNRESAEVIWDATPFETRLEKALEKESSGEHILAM